MVSLIIPMKNSSRYIEQCLDSLAIQSNPHYELLLIDNGSIDSTMDIAMKYMSKDNRIKVFVSEGGIGTARNRGIDESSVESEYLFFLDSDDFFDCQMIEKMVKAAKTTGADVIISKAYRYNHLTQKKRIMDYQSAILLPEEHDHLYFTKEISNTLFQTTVANPWAKMFSKELILRHNIRFQNLQNSNDISFVYTAMSLSKKIEYLADPLVFYRTHHGSACQGTKDDYPLECLLAYTKLKEQLLQHGLYDIYKETYKTLVIEGYEWNYNSLLTEKAKRTLAINRDKFYELVKEYYDDSFI